MKRNQSIQANSATVEPSGAPCSGGYFCIEEQARNMAVTTKLTLSEKLNAEQAADDLGESRSGVLRAALLHFLDLRPAARKRYMQALGSSS